MNRTLSLFSSWWWKRLLAPISHHDLKFFICCVTGSRATNDEDCADEVKLRTATGMAVMVKLTILNDEDVKKVSQHHYLSAIDERLGLR